VADYRITITGAEATDQDHVKLNCAIEKQNDVGGWDLLDGGPGAIYLPTAQVLGILRAGTSLAEQRDELVSAVRKAARGLPILQGDVAVDRLTALLPAGWPVTVEL
jgi:hypothetical protein